jgi:RHS repeat-associated protein
LRGINLDANNNTATTNGDLFSMKLGYETDGYFDGNIGKQDWKTSLDNVNRSFTYTYDGASRIKTGTYAGTGTENYSLNSVTYDANGNIKTLSRSGYKSNNTFGVVDNLSYTYNTNSNKILKVDDLSNETASFKDVVGNDYTYSLDGSLISDANKGITLIEYNYLKRPKKITFSNSQTIEYQYDANGKKLREKDKSGVWTDYVGNKIYRNNALYQISHDEGRIVNSNYEYNITDHLGNLRVAFKDSSGIAKIVQSNSYGIWGEDLPTLKYLNTPKINNFGYLNREFQLETGYTDLVNRQFDNIIGRFTSPDPITDGQEHLSLYQYGYDNPILRSDPNGDCPKCWEWLKKQWDNAGAYFNKPASQVEKEMWSQRTGLPQSSIKTNNDVFIAIVFEGVQNANFRSPSKSIERTRIASSVSTSSTSEVNLQVRADAIQNSQPNSKARNLSTVSVSEIANADGTTQIGVSSSRQRLTPAQRNAMQEGEVEIKGKGHAEETIVNYAQNNGATVLRIAASRPVCENCQVIIGTTSAVIESPVKPIKIPFKVE